VPFLDDRLRPTPPPAPGLKDDERGGGKGGEGIVFVVGVLDEDILTAIMILLIIFDSREDGCLCVKCDEELWLRSRYKG
jgi:hypothetical protein